MTYEQFWYGEPEMVKAYRKADRIRWNRLNTEAWLNGRYNFIGVSTALANGFSKSRKDYLKEPFDIFDKTEEEQKVADQQAKEMVHSQLMRMVAQQQRKKQDG